MRKKQEKKEKYAIEKTLNIVKNINTDNMQSLRKINI